MKYNLASSVEVVGARKYLDLLVLKQTMVEIRKINPRRSLNQNNYLHLLIGAFGSHFGYSLEEAKQVYKEINHDIFAYNKKGRSFYRSTADLDKEEMSKSIDRFRKKSAEQGCPLPLATDQDWLRAISNEIERSRYYL